MTGVDRENRAGRSRGGRKVSGSDPTSEASRRTEILLAANSVISTSGLGTSLQQIADAAGILTGSLYHHFKSKDALFIELRRRYRAALDQIGEAALTRLDDPDSGPVPDQLIDLCNGVARCAVEHQAALQMSFFEGPTKDPGLIDAADAEQPAIERAMLAVLRAGRRTGYIRPDVDLSTAADRLCQGMMHAGLDVIRHDASGDDVAKVLYQIFLNGLASRDPSLEALDQSAALSAADRVVGTWRGVEDSGADTASRVRAAARSEFSRRGFEVTSIRDIAAAAGLPPGTVYRHIGSKEEMLKSIMVSFIEKVGAAWSNIALADSSPIEKLDALSWLSINALDRFPDEFTIQLGWMRQAPPHIAEPAWSFDARVHEINGLLSEGMKDGDLRIEAPSAETLARCVIGSLWIPPNIVRELGPRAALIHCRDTVLRGITVRGSEAGSR